MEFGIVYAKYYKKFRGYHELQHKNANILQYGRILVRVMRNDRIILKDHSED